MNALARNPRFRAHPLVAAIAAAFLAPAGVAAEPLFQVPLYGNADMTRYETNNVELGVGYNDVSGAEYKFGEWNGLFRQDPFAIANLNWLSRNFATGAYGSVWGYNLGVPSRRLGGSVGTQGLWGLTGEFQQITHAQTNQGSFIFNGLGSDRLTLPDGFTGISAGNSQPPANAAAIVPFEQSGFGVKIDRDIYKVGGNWRLGNGFEAVANFRYDQRDGTRITGAVMGNSGGNPRSVLAPYKVDDNTTQIEAALRYYSRDLQFTLSYWYSKYRDESNSFTWQNPYASITGWQANSGVGFPTGFGRMALPPDNDFNQIQATGGYNFTPTTRLTATFQYGVARQNDQFLPQTIDAPPLVTPGLATPFPLPASSLDGKIKNTLFDVTLTSRPIGKLYVKLNYHYDDRDNTTPDRIFVYTPGDTLSQAVIPPGQTPEQVNSNYIRTNPVPGITENRFTADADYPLARGITLRGFYEYKKTDYKPAEDELRADTHVNEIGAELKFRTNPVVNGYVKYVHDERRGSDFSTNRPYAAVVNAPTLVFNNFDTNPTTRQFLVADYDQDRIKAMATITPPGDTPFSLQLMGDWWKRNYKGPDCGGPNDQLLIGLSPSIVFPAQCLGLQKSENQSYTLDGQYAAGNGVSLYAFVTWSRYDTDQLGRSFSSVTQGAATIGQSADPARNWTVGIRTTDTAVGAGMDWKPEGKPYSAGIQYLYNDGSSAFALASGPALTTASSPIPDVKNTLNSLQLFGRWQYSKNLLFRANYWYQHYRSRDWAFDNATPTSSNNVLLTGQPSPSYNANVFGVSVSYTNW